MKAKKLWSLALTLALSLAFFASCKRNSIEEPSPFGPSTYSTLLDVTASPNVLFAGDYRETSTITATLKKFDGIPLPNRTIIFDVHDATGAKVAIGWFEGQQSAKAKTTDQSGQASVIYSGPLAREIQDSGMIYIYATVSGDGKESVIELVPIEIIREASEIVFNLYADPNVLWTSNSRPQSQIKGEFKKADGTPFVGRKIFFKIISGLGSFEGNTTKTYNITDENGYATVTYFGPKSSEIAYDQFVTIQGQPETSAPDYVYEEIAIRLIKGN